MHIRTVIIVAAALQCTCKEGKRPGLRVINGQPDSDRRYPYVVALVQTMDMDDNDNDDGQMIRYCTGTLISPEWVLTAAHCVHEGKPDPDEKQRVVYGDLRNTLNETRHYRKIKKCLKHPHFRMWSYTDLMGREIQYVKYDIALVEIDTLVLKIYGKVSAVDYKSLIGRQVVYAGAGLTTPYRQRYDEERYNQSLFIKHQLEDNKKPLQIGYGVVTSYDRDLYFEASVQPAILVASKCSKKDHGVTSGDSGGPLFYKGRVVGICQGGTIHVMAPAIYTPISSSLDWIARTVSTKKCT